MRVAIVHYHLAPGGVTRVIDITTQVLTRAGVEHVILTGDEPPGGGVQLQCGPSHVVRIPGLGYATSASGPTADELLAELRTRATAALGAAPDLWHFHNPSLGKNRLIPDVIERLAESGERLVLHLHDLAEAGRPANYPLIADVRKLYPISPRIRYAFLNTRDLHAFTEAGLPPENALLLPNPVTVPSATTDSKSSRAILFAPVRGIRRKNLGELVFLSALAPAETWFAISRAPLNPDALPVHDAWRKFTKRHQLPIEFDVVGRFSPAAGSDTGFAAWVAHASHFISASVEEGFGLPFLEAAAHGKPLLGRNLSHLTEEHAQHGIRSGHLYDQLLIPTEWVELTILRDHITRTLERNYRAYQRPLTHEMIEAVLGRLLHGDWLDFGNLPESLQQGAIERLLSEYSNRRVPLVQVDGVPQPAVEWLAAVVADRRATATPEQLAPYAPESYQAKLTTLYQDLSKQPAGPVTQVPPGRILDLHLTANRFHFLLSVLPPAAVDLRAIRAVVFDIYGTLLIAPPGGVRPDPLADPVLRQILRDFDHDPPASPSSELHAAVQRHHDAAGIEFPEVDLRVLWREILGLEPGTDTTALVEALEAAWHPARPMPGADILIGTLARSGISLGLISNAQSNTLSSLGGITNLFAPELSILSYQQGAAKPAPVLFELLADRLSGRGILPGETLVVGNDPLHDIVPAAAAGFQTALFTGHPDSLRPGPCDPDIIIKKWAELILFIRNHS